MKALRRSVLVRYLVIPITLVALLSGCYKWSPPGQSPADYIRAEEPSKVRVTLTDGDRFVVEHPTVGEEGLTGIARDTRVTIPLDQIRSFEVQRTNAKTTGALILVGATVYLVVGFANTCNPFDDECF